MSSPFVVIYARGHPLWSMFYTVVPCSASTLSTAGAMTVHRFWNSQTNTDFCIWYSSVTLGNCHWRDDSSHPGTVLSGTASIIGQPLIGCQLLRYSTTSTISIHREGHFIRPVNGWNWPLGGRWVNPQARPISHAGFWRAPWRRKVKCVLSTKSVWEISSADWQRFVMGIVW